MSLCTQKDAVGIPPLRLAHKKRLWILICYSRDHIQTGLFKFLTSDGVDITNSVHLDIRFDRVLLKSFVNGDQFDLGSIQAASGGRKLL